ncbi:hypothetical protein HYH02_001994 [Chlamydomonas schloesseri]|uniref:DUF4145 domain-containing protein n=1 Tax=Chlamydomonas schloesseri TaxID=2026947 RepID=A0A836BCF8_9CHLO|nr:hypothetical protein HYH02_001994 [Chlamydomonas schloesseri]|eukprot:KAG2453785.1 hypothetical protein HYH02_001994 [Chlamydomonas schloesseri]
MERTLKEDLQDDLQVLIDLIQHSCKPHPRPPRAGMKTLIVQGRILAEAIAQDALFQLDPEPAAADPAAAASRPDLVELINRLREHHGNSLLGPALHVLRTLGNTAVHLDRDSARLTDAEIGDAAAVCCRLVVHVVDAYMHMCANLHRHDETQEALAQPLQETPVAPIPAPNVLMRPREQSPTAPPAANAAAATPASASGSVGSGSAPRVAGHVLGNGRNATGPGMAAATPSARRVSGSGHAMGNSDEDGEDDIVYTVSGGRCLSVGGGSGGRTHGGSMDGGPDKRVPYSLVPPDWAAGATGFGVAVVSAADAALDAVQGPGHGAAAPGSRSWWPAMGPADAAAAAASAAPTALSSVHVQSPIHMLRRPAAVDAAAVAADAAASGGFAHAPYAAEAASRPAAPQQAASVTDWLEAFSLRPAAAAAGAAPAVGTGQHSNSGGGASDAGAHHMAPYMVPPAAFPVAASSSAATAHLHTGYANGSAAPPADAWAASSAVQAARAYYQHTPAPLQPGAGPQLAGSSPTRRSPLTLMADPHQVLGGAGAGQPHAAHMAQPAAARGASPPPVPFVIPCPMPGSGNSPLREALAQPTHAPVAGAATAGSGSGGAAGAGTVMSPAEASKRLVQLCATAQAPSAAKVMKLLAAGATLATTDKSGMNALHMACYWGHAEAAGLLLGSGNASGGRAGAAAAAAAVADREGRTPLWVASQRGHVELVRLLLAQSGGEGGVDVNAANSSGVTPLRVAAAQGHTEVVAALLAAGAAPDRADKDAFTPLYVACARSHLEVVRLLLSAGAPADRCDKAGRTPLWAALHPGGSAKAEACPERRSAVVRALLAAGADVHLLPDVRDRDYCWQVLAQSIAAGE